MPPRLTSQARAAAALIGCAILAVVGLVVAIVTGLRAAPEARAATPVGCAYHILAESGAKVPADKAACLTAPTDEHADVAQPTLQAAITVYGAPDDGALIGPVEAGRPFTPLAQTSDGAWLQLDIVGSGAVWARAQTVRGIDIGSLAILDPPPPTAAPAPPVVAQQEPAPAPQAQTYEATYEPPTASQVLDYVEQQADTVHVALQPSATSTCDTIPRPLACAAASDDTAIRPPEAPANGNSTSGKMPVSNLGCVSSDPADCTSSQTPSSGGSDSARFCAAAAIRCDDAGNRDTTHAQP